MTPRKAQATPELDAAAEALDRLPEAWVSDALGASVLRRAALLTARRLLTERSEACRAAIETAAAQVAAGGDFAALDQLVASEGELLAVERATGALAAPDLDDAAVRAALGAAQAALDASDRRLGLPVPAYLEQTAQWRRHSTVSGQVVDPPLPTDSDREVAARFAALSEEVERAVAGSRAWRSDARTGTADALQLLAGAAGYLDAVEPLAAEVADFRAEVEEANAARAAAGLTWIHPVEALGFRVAL